MKRRKLEGVSGWNLLMRRGLQGGEWSRERSRKAGVAAGPFNPHAPRSRASRRATSVSSREYREASRPSITWRAQPIRCRFAHQHCIHHGRAIDVRC